MHSNLGGMRVSCMPVIKTSGIRAGAQLTQRSLPSYCFHRRLMYETEMVSILATHFSGRRRAYLNLDQRLQDSQFSMRRKEKMMRVDQPVRVYLEYHRMNSEKNTQEP